MFAFLCFVFLTDYKDDKKIAANQMYALIFKKK